MQPERRRDLGAALLVAAVAFLPFLRGALAGASLYFRDLALYFLPLRRYALAGLAHGEVRLWNPLVHEGVPLSLPALGYPLDLLQLLRPDERGISLALALHVPLAAVAFLWLARGLGLARTAAAGGAIVYALGGFLLSTVNLYVYLQAAAWAPLVVLALARVLATGAPRAIALASLVLALALSTTGLEIAAQALLFGVVVGWPGARRRRHPLRAAGAVALAAALAAPVLVLVGSQVEGSARGRGFATDVVLAHSVHPFTFVQVLVAGLYGNPADLANQWWGQNFFPRGFPYLLSLYLGPCVLALAALGSLRRHPLRGRLLALVAFGAWVALGRWGGLAPVVDLLPPLHVLRFPVKAFFTVHLAAALLAALGLQALFEEGRSAWGRLALAAALPALGLASLTPLVWLLPAAAGRFAERFFPPGYAPAVRTMLLQRVLADAATGAAIAMLLALLAFVARKERLGGKTALVLVLAVVASDLLRAGAGLNPMVAESFLRPSPEVAAHSAVWRGGRVFTCPVDESAAYRQGRAARPSSHELWSFAALEETLTPAFNVPLGVPTAMSPDLTMLVPEDRTLPASEASCDDMSALVPRLRAAAVDRVLSVEPLASPDLVAEPPLRPLRIAPLAVYAYRLSRPDAFVRLQSAAGAAQPTGTTRLARSGPGRIDVEVEAPAAGELVVLEGWSNGWRARVNGRPEAVSRAAGSHLGVRLQPGPSHVELRFVPRALAPAVALSAAAILALLWLALRGQAPVPRAG